MKNLNTALKVIGAIATIAGILYVIVNYGDRIIDWTKAQLDKLKSRNAVQFYNTEEAVAAENVVTDEDLVTEE